MSVQISDDEVADMDIDMVGGKEVERMDKSLGSNSMRSCTSSLNTTCQGVYPFYKSTTAKHLLELKREHCDDIDASPGVFRVYSNHPLREATISMHAYQVKEEYCDDFDARRISGPVTSTTIVAPISMSRVQMPPPGFPEFPEPKRGDSSPKQSPSVVNATTLATSSFCNTPVLPYQLSLPSDKSNPLPLESVEQDGGRGINVADRMKKFKIRFTQEQKDKMLIFAENVGWSIRKQEEAVVQKFCQEVGVDRRALKVWMYNKKHDLKSHSFTACTRRLQSRSPKTPNFLCVECDEQVGGGGGINASIRAPHLPVKKRFKTKFTQEQKDKMWSFAEKVGWHVTKQEAAVQQFCEEVGISSRVLKFWMCNTKQNLKIKLSSACNSGTL